MAILVLQIHFWDFDCIFPSGIFFKVTPGRTTRPIDSVRAIVAPHALCACMHNHARALRGGAGLIAPVGPKVPGNPQGSYETIEIFHTNF